MDPLKRNVTPESLLLSAWDFLTALQNAVRASSHWETEGSCGEEKQELSPHTQEELFA
ncbi:hypothetical protein HispidOSU_018263, partial [Sigmodon hispidus]